MMNSFESSNEIRCTLCGAVFEPDENTCAGCAIRKNCNIVCCPNCGLGVPKESKLVQWLNKRNKKDRSVDRGTE